MKSLSKEEKQLVKDLLYGDKRHVINYKGNSIFLPENLLNAKSLPSLTQTVKTLGLRTFVVSMALVLDKLIKGTITLQL
eukprot:Pgem_evm3s10637